MGRILDNNYSREYYIIYQPVKRFRWWNIFTGKKYAHLLLITPLADGRSLVIDPTLGGTYIIEDNNSAYILSTLYAQSGDIVQKYVADGRIMIYPTFKVLRTCVSITKDLLGIKGFIFTPKQLYRRIKNG